MPLPMPATDNATLERLRRSTYVREDVWFLAGATQVGESIRHLPIDEQPYVIGRKTGVALKLQYKTVSGNHASMWIDEGRLFLRDLGSTNGTYVNGKRLDGETVVSEEDLIHFAEAPFRVLRQSPTGQTAGTLARNVCDEALALVQFDRMMSQRLVRPHFQPIVRLDDASPIGFEVLGRGSVFGLESVGAMFQAAEQLNLEVELSCLLRWEGIRVGRDITGQPKLFVNTHPREMENAAGLIQSLTGVREMTGSTPLVLEIHEAAVTNPAFMNELSAALKELAIELAYDDFGAGQARLAELIAAKPEYVKFDISLIRNIDNADTFRIRMLKTLVRMVRDLDIRALAEGIETEAEANCCQEIGFDLGQGYFFGRPSPA